MKNTPLSSGEQSKIILFILLLLPAIFLAAGILPAIFLIFGFSMMKRNEDFGYIEAAVRAFKVYTVIPLLILGGCVIVFGYEYKICEGYCSGRTEALLITLGFFTITLAYIILVHVLFLSPLRKHNQWVTVNGVFSSKPNSSKINNALEADIIKGEKFKTYSVADELIKWAQLKEGGHISEQQYDDAKNKLLKRG
jgi:hypothetical protein